MRGFSLRKLFLDFLAIVCLAIAGWTGYQLFVQHALSPLSGSIIFIVDIGVLVWNTSVLQSSQYKWRSPSFKLIFFSLLGIVLVLAFAGVQPLAEYKNTLISKADIGLGKGAKPDAVIPPGQSSSVRNWFISLDGGEWHGCTVTVDLTVTNIGSQVAEFGHYSVGYPDTLCVVDAYGQSFSAEDTGAWDAWYQVGTYYPGESRSGTLKFIVNPMSGQVRLIGDTAYWDTQTQTWSYITSFNLGSVPSTYK